MTMSGWLPFIARVMEKVVNQLLTTITKNSINVFSVCHSAIYYRLGFENPELFVNTWVSDFENTKLRFRFFLLGLIMSVKAPKCGPQCPFEWIEVCCIVTRPNMC